MITPNIIAKMLSATLLTATLLLPSTEAAARRRTGSDNANHTQVQREPASASGQLGYKMSSNSDADISGHKFVIDGQVALDVKDAKYNIYITDIDKEITDADLAGCVDVKNKTFRFETNISAMKAGRIRGVMPDGSLNPAWINVYFIPAFTLDLKINNGSYDIENDSEYNFMANAWLNKDALAVLFESMGASKNGNKGTETSDIDIALNAYRKMQANLQQQISEFNKMGVSPAQILGLVHRIDAINAKMEAIIDKFASSIKY